MSRTEIIVKRAFPAGQCIFDGVVYDGLEEHLASYFKAYLNTVPIELRHTNTNRYGRMGDVIIDPKYIVGHATSFDDECFHVSLNEFGISVIDKIHDPILRISVLANNRDRRVIEILKLVLDGGVFNE